MTKRRKKEAPRPGNEVITSPMTEHELMRLAGMRAVLTEFLRIAEVHHAMRIGTFGIRLASSMLNVAMMVTRKAAMGWHRPHIIRVMGEQLLNVTIKAVLDEGGIEARDFALWFGPIRRAVIRTGHWGVITPRLAREPD